MKTPKLPTFCLQHFKDGCTNHAWCRGLCPLHYGRWQSGRPLDGPSLRVRGVYASCTVEGCANPPRYYGLCRLHKERENAHGSATLADELIEQQGGLCAICRRPPRGKGHESRLHLDHDHVTGRNREMLCGPCNKALGLFSDNPLLVRAAFEYLVGHAAAVMEVA